MDCEVLSHDSGKKLASKATRDGVAERFPDPAVQKRMEVDVALIHHDDRLRGDLELSILETAKPHYAHTLDRRRTVPGIGEVLSLVLQYAIHDIGRIPRVQDFVAYGRLVQCPAEASPQSLKCPSPRTHHRPGWLSR